MRIFYLGVGICSLYIYTHIYIYLYIHSFIFYLFLLGKRICVWQPCTLLIESSRELNQGHCSWEASAAQLHWIAGNPGVQHNSNIQVLFHIRKYFLIITVGVSEWFVRFVSVSQIRRRGPIACFLLPDKLHGKEWAGSAWGSVALFSWCRWNQPHQNCFRRNRFSLVQFLNLGYAASCAGTKHRAAAGEKQTDGWTESGTGSFRNSTG